MITYKGQKTVIGKRYLYEGQIIRYQGKIYGDKHLFKSSDLEYILSESDLNDLQSFEVESAKIDIVKNIQNNDELKNTIIDYTQKELNLLSDLIAGKSKDVASLNKLYQEEIDELLFLNKYGQPNVKNSNISLEAQQSYLNNINRNVSDTSIISLLASLQDFIASNKEV